MPDERTYGMARGKVFPADEARSLLNPLRRLVQSPRRTVAAMGLTGAERVLEVGSGPGFFSPHLADAVPRGQLTVVDLQIEMLALARERLLGRVNVVLAEGDASCLPARDAAFDAVFLATMLGEVPDRDGCIAEVRRVVTDEGIVSIAETRRDSDFISLPELTDLLHSNGFTFLDRHGPGWQYVARFQAA